MRERRLSLVDQLLVQADRALSTFLDPARAPSRPSPTLGLEQPVLATQDRRHVEGLMRVNHAGEVAAQALYQGQSLTARSPAVRRAMQRAAREENDHLVWCEERLKELGGRTSLLNPLWYTGSLAIGALAGLAGDGWSLGFIAETERQVVEHLDRHLEDLPKEDGRSRRLLEQMKLDEAEHGAAASRAGGRPLPAGAKRLMQLTARIMTRTAYWI